MQVFKHKHKIPSCNKIHPITVKAGATENNDQWIKFY